MRFLVFLVSAAALAQMPDTPVRAVTDPGMVTTRQQITPAGVPSVFTGRVYGVTFGRDASELWVLNASHVYQMDWRQNKVLAKFAVGGLPGLQGIQYSGGRALISSAHRTRGVQLATAEAEPSVLGDNLGKSLAGAVNVFEDMVVVPAVGTNQVSVFRAGKLVGTFPTGIAPFAGMTDGKTVYVTNWGGRVASAKDLTAPTGLAATADNVVIDDRGIAATGTVTRIDLTGSAQPRSISVGLHPTAMTWDRKGGRLYVANANSDSISVIDTRTDRVVRTFDVQPFATRVAGISPVALALTADSTRLYVACGGINAVIAMHAATGKIEGAIPTAWYPNGLALSPDGKKLAVSALLGAGSGWREGPGKRFVHAYRGSVAVIDVPDAPQLASYTTAVWENNRMNTQAAAPVRNVKPRPLPVPERAGDPSPIEHVVYIVKENRTYDQVFGDLPKGNGDPSLVMFGEDVTPNQHRLADQYVVLDNFYATGGNSADGHQWVTQANETAYCLWPGYTGRSYPYDGTDPIAYSRSGFIWDTALARGKTVRVFGEYAPRLPEPPKMRVELLERWKAGEDFTSRWSVKSPIPALDRVLVRNYPTYSNGVPDVIRAQIFLAELKNWNVSGEMPNLAIVQLPSNHTFGTLAGVSTPKAMVADNDYALGLIVEALSKSKFWPKMAIFVVEDDAQNGVDHVDGHRTVALAVSPYTKRGHVDSTFYSHQSILKTIELILGLPALSLFDLIANDMRHSFIDVPDFTAYEAVRPKQSLDERTPPLQALSGAARRAALESAKMRWDIPDAVPTEKLNRILWGNDRGWNTRYPASRAGVFAPLSLDIDDDDR